MPTEKNAVRKEVIVGVAAAVATTVATAALGYVDDVIRFMIIAAKAVWVFMATPLSIPLGIVILAILVVSIFAWRALRSVQMPTETGEALAAVPSVTIDTVQFRVLRALAEADGRPLSIDRLATETGVSRLQLSKSLEELLRTRYIEAEPHYLEGTLIFLSGRGRDFVLEMKLPH